MQIHRLAPQCFAAATLVLLLAACHQTDRQPANLLPPDRMVDFLSEAYLIEGRYAVETSYQYRLTSSPNIDRYDSLLSAQGLTAAEIDSSLAWYSLHLEEYQSIMDSVVARLSLISEASR